MSDELIITFIVSLTTMLVATGGGSLGLWRYMQGQEDKRQEAIKVRELDTNKHMEAVKAAAWERATQTMDRQAARCTELEEQLEECNAACRELAIENGRLKAKADRGAAASG